MVAVHTFGLGVQNPWSLYFVNTYNAGVRGATVYDMIDIAFAIYEQKDLIDYYFLFHGERMVVYKNGKQEALMPYSEHFDEFKSIDLDTKMYYNSRSVNHLLAFC